YTIIIFTYIAKKKNSYLFMDNFNENTKHKTIIKKK
ncbi:hypothetical protein ME9_00179, partial [Bartonella taylorii 8TBB]